MLTGTLGVDIPEGQRIIVLIDNLGRDLCEYVRKK